MGIQTVKEVENLGRAPEHVGHCVRELLLSYCYEHLLNTDKETEKNKSYPSKLDLISIII